MTAAHLENKNEHFGFFTFPISDKKIRYVVLSRSEKKNNNYVPNLLTYESFVCRANEKYGNLYDYTDSYVINVTKKVNITCNNCKSVFYQIPINHIYNDCGCVNCFGGKPQNSKGERKIKSFLEKRGFEYVRQKTFSDCDHLIKLRFDFYLPKQNLLIEFDGKQHFQSINFFGGDSGFNIQKRRDKIKNEYAQNNGIRLIRIPYYEYNNIEKILNNII